MVKTGLIGDQFSSEWCHFSTALILFNQVIHHDDKVKPKKLSSFTMKTTKTKDVLVCQYLGLNLWLCL